MLETLKDLLVHQFEASLATLGNCIEQCSDAHWTRPVGNLPVWRVVSHVLYFADYSLSPNEKAHQPPPFHRNDESFPEYLPGNPYSKDDLRTYLQTCRSKAGQMIAAETAGTLAGPSGFERRKITRAELHVYNIRHIQHHAAQISLALRRDAGIAIEWVGTGWS